MRRTLSTRLMVDLGVLLVLLLVLWSASRPEFRGGILIPGIAGLVAVLQIVAMLREHVFMPRGSATTASVDSREYVPAAPEIVHVVEEEEVPADLSGREAWLAVGYLALLFLLVYFLGTVAGCTLFVALFCATQPGFRWQVALPMIVLVGIGAPYLLSSTLGLRLWEGVIPEVIPGWVGGGLAPPL